MNDNDPINPSGYNRTRRKLIEFILRGIVTVLLLYFLASRLDFQEVPRILSETRLGIVLAALGVFLARNLFAGLRWQKLLKSKGYDLAPIRLSRYYLIGNFFGFFLPSTFGGDVVRGFYIYLDGIRRLETVSSVVIERIFGISVMLTFSLFSLLLDYDFIDNSSIKLIVLLPGIAAIAGLTIFYGFPLPEIKFNFKIPILARMTEMIKRLTHSLHSYSDSVHAIYSAIFFSSLYHLSGVLTYYLIGRSLGDSTGFLIYLILFSPIMLIALIPVSINGLGLREGSFVFLFSLAGMEREIAIIISFLYLLITVVQAALGGILYLFDPRDIKSIKNHSMDQQLDQNIQ